MVAALDAAVRFEYLNRERLGLVESALVQVQAGEIAQGSECVGVIVPEGASVPLRRVEPRPVTMPSQDQRYNRSVLRVYWLP